MKRIYVFLLLCCLLLALSGCGAPASFDGSRTSDDKHFYMDYRLLNMTETRSFTLNDGDAIDVSVVCEAGDLSVIIQKGDDMPVYEGHSLATGSFRVTVHESGTYNISVTGKMAKGSVRFEIMVNE